MESIRNPFTSTYRWPVFVLLLALLTGPLALGAEVTPDEMTRWLNAMKEAPRGPFESIRWFCKDGAILPPGPYACASHGGGRQHGQLNTQARALREAGYPVGTVLAALDPRELAAPEARARLKGILLERYLVAADDGWILRQARYYRGAFQAEEEMSAAAELLTELARHDAQGRDFLLLRQAALLLPRRGEQASLTHVHELSTTLAELDPGFAPLRNKIHAQPDAGDAERVRTHARDNQRVEPAFESLAQAIDTLFARRDLAQALSRTATKLGKHPLARRLQQQSEPWSRPQGAEQRLASSAALLVELRETLDGLGPRQRIAALDLGIDLEAESFTAGLELLRGRPRATRAQRLVWLGQIGDVLYGVGLLTRRERQEIAQSLARLGGASVPLGRYRSELRLLDRVPHWAGRELAFHFAESIEHLAAIEPKVRHFIPHRLRASPLLAYSGLLDELLREANVQAGIEHRVFGQVVGAGLRSLNPGLARGRLRLEAASPRPDDIVLLPETAAELPPVAGILTREEGNALSHVQILAGNLGIPNVVVDAAILPLLKAHDGQRVLLAVSSGGQVLLAEDGPQWDAAFAGKEAVPERLRAEMDRLELERRVPIPLDRLRADDAGRVVGPKAAKLGELKHLYPEAVAEGLAIPFGAFRALLDQPMPGTGRNVFDWMRAEYRRIAELPLEQRTTEGAALRERLRGWAESADPGPAFRETLRQAMTATFGTADQAGVFVRSDTNVEDLPGFTGAGLNLTVPNVIGFDDVLRAIQRVWASPFAERAFAWRQMRMENPEHVYVSVLLQRAVPVEKSGVMLTMDAKTGDMGAFTIAVSEGVGGAVSGEGAEEWRLDAATGEARLLAEASVATRRVLPPAGGIERLPASGEGVLTPAELEALRRLGNQLPQRFPLHDEEGKPLPADVEFGFIDGRLALFQIRPYQQSRAARRSRFLLELDRPLREHEGRMVNLRETP
ncbi:MAG: PEP/pyruvate-binding domain-containing protein [Pseudomonadota bacterium]